MLIRERRLAKGWSIVKLAEEVGLGATSMSLISLIEQGEMAPRLDVAEKLAQVLDIEAAPLIDWARQTRHRLHAPRDVSAQSEYIPRAEAWQQRLRASAALPSIEWAPGPLTVATHRARAARDDLPLYDAGADPDRTGVRPIGFIPTDDVPPSLLLMLVRPVVFVVSDEDFERLKRPIYGVARPRYALVTRAPVETIDPREPYAVRRHRRVLLAYVGWDGHELFILPPPGKPGFDRAGAEGLRGLQSRVVGQVVAMMGWR